MLRAMLLTLSTGNTLGCTARIFSKCSTLQVISSSRFFSFGIHRIITAECTRNIHSFWAWHAVTTSCTSHFYIFLNLIFYLFDQLPVGWCETSHRSLPAGRKAISTQVLPECDVFHPCGITLSQIPGEGSPDVRHEAAP